MGEAMKKTILLVDDEVNVTNSLKRLLRNDGYTILTASSGSEALELLDKNEVQVVLSDQRMPEMTGAQLLTEVNTRFPETIRMILSGYADFNDIIEAINGGKIYRFLGKPWDDQKLRDQIYKAFELYEKNQNQNIYDKLTGAYSVYYLEQYLSDMMNVSDSTGTMMGFAVVGMDRFQLINDAFGHEAGDQVLIQMATRIKNWAAECRATVIRLREDEFAAVIPTITDRGEGEYYIEKLHSLLSEPVEFNENTFKAECSVGMIMYSTQKVCSLEDLIRNGRNAMSFVRQRGGNDFRIF